MSVNSGIHKMEGFRKNSNDTMVLEMEQLHDFLSDSLVISKEIVGKSKSDEKENVAAAAVEIKEQPAVPRLAVPDETLRSSERSIFTLGNVRATEQEKAKQITPDVITHGKKLIIRV